MWQDHDFFQTTMWQVQKYEKSPFRSFFVVTLLFSYHVRFDYQQILTLKAHVSASFLTPISKQSE